VPNNARNFERYFQTFFLRSPRASRANCCATRRATIEPSTFLLPARDSSRVLPLRVLHLPFFALLGAPRSNRARARDFLFPRFSARFAQSEMPKSSGPRRPVFFIRNLMFDLGIARAKNNFPRLRRAIKTPGRGEIRYCAEQMHTRTRGDDGAPACSGNRGYFIPVGILSFSPEFVKF